MILRWAQNVCKHLGTLQCIDVEPPRWASYMKNCTHRYSENVVIGGKNLLAFKCGISKPKGAIVGEEVCAGCDVVDLVLDCEHLSPRVKHFLGYRTETHYRCNYFNAVLDPEKGFCRVCRYKSKKTKSFLF